ncbi:Zinc knuckle CX2CX4HX4C [Corchorus olitorius]|uniref:Zinc knuckle CX2CX4HX4C n=1 Tax=Corchorus olitorius TaxID=93759 RepID=A0A1R3HM43_9ROSI|nr:Zinc knuckle CX2CX4HX4C [Corchorus olitorius]
MLRRSERLKLTFIASLLRHKRSLERALEGNPWPHNLPREMLMRSNGEMIGKVIGDVLEVEEPRGRFGVNMGFLRLKVMVDSNIPLKYGFWFPCNDQGQYWAEIKYEKLPNFCFDCSRLGHGCKFCNFVCDEDCRKRRRCYKLIGEKGKAKVQEEARGDHRVQARDLDRQDMSANVGEKSTSPIKRMFSNILSGPTHSLGLASPKLVDKEIVTMDPVQKNNQVIGHEEDQSTEAEVLEEEKGQPEESPEEFARFLMSRRGKDSVEHNVLKKAKSSAHIVEVPKQNLFMPESFEIGVSNSRGRGRGRGRRKLTRVRRTRRELTWIEEESLMEIPIREVSEIAE